MLLIFALAGTYFVLNRKSIPPEKPAEDSLMQETPPVSQVSGEETELENIDISENESDFQQLREAAEQL